MDFYLKKILMQLITDLNIYRYSTVALSTFLEGVSIPIPSLIILLLAGFLASQGNMNIYIIITLAAVSYTIGSSIPYLIGYSISKGFSNKFSKYIKVPEEHLKKIESLFTKYGEKAVCFTRPVLIGNYISYFAGINKMSLIKFYSYTFLGILPWAALVVFIGSKFGKSYNAAYSTVKSYMIYFDIFLFAALIIFLIIKRDKIFTTLKLLIKRSR